MSKFVVEDLVLFDLDVKNFNDMVDEVSRPFVLNGYVKDSYVDAVKKREVNFPTGLQLTNTSIGMPHTDPGHANKTGITVALLRNDITINQMEDPSKTVEAKLIFMLCVSKPEEQMVLLQKLMTILQNDVAMTEFMDSKSKQELYIVADKYFN